MATFNWRFPRTWHKDFGSMNFALPVVLLSVVNLLEGCKGVFGIFRIFENKGDAICLLTCVGNS